MGPPSSEELGATGILKRQAPAWWWLRKNFTLPAVLAIGGLVAGAGSWLWAQHAAIEELRRKVASISDPGTRFESIESRLNKLELYRAALTPQLSDYDRRIAAQEHEWQVVHDEAARGRRRAR
jgi:hypothetical protein